MLTRADDNADEDLWHELEKGKTFRVLGGLLEHAGDDEEGERAEGDLKEEIEWLIRLKASAFRLKGRKTYDGCELVRFVQVTEEELGLGDRRRRRVRQARQQFVQSKHPDHLFDEDDDSDGRDEALEQGSREDDVEEAHPEEAEREGDDPDLRYERVSLSGVMVWDSSAGYAPGNQSL